MADAEDNSNREQCASSASRMVPRQSPLKLDYKSTQCASFVSQRSSSLETNGSSSPTNSSDGNFLEPQVQDIPDNNVSSERSDESAVEGNSTTVNRDSTSTDPQHWLCNDESLPSSLLHPEHQSTPAKDNKYMSTVDGEGDSALAHLSGESTTEPDEEKEKEVFLPGDLHTPILGFETMEERSRFTVFKIRVQKTASGLESSGWFVFRRYSDFLHLNERLKSLFPGFRLSLPPKRWFRNNFDKNFLEDRMIGLQAFLDNITGHKDICNSDPVRSFLCTDDPPGPHDSLEESRALCETLEESMYTLRQELQEKETEVSLLKEELDLYKSQVQLLSTQLRVLNSSLPRADSTVTPSSTRHSLAECDRHSMPSPTSLQPKSGSQLQVQDSVSE